MWPRGGGPRPYAPNVSSRSVTAPGEPAVRAVVGHLEIDVVTQAQVVDRVSAGILDGRGGQVVTPNLDIWLRTRHEREVRDVVSTCDVVVGDGMPLVWAARLGGTPLPERVTGSGLVEKLAERGAEHGWRIFVVGGGEPGTGELALTALASRYPGLVAAGGCTPEFGFERDPERLEQLVEQVVQSRPDLVLIGLGFPKQEHLAVRLRERLPATWFLGCGAGVQMAAGLQRRPPEFVQRRGGEWLWRMAQDPRRLVRRYLVDDLPAAFVLFAVAATRRFARV